MERAIAFALALALVSAYALIKGGAPERYAAALYCTAYVLSIAATQVSPDYYASVEWSVMAIDIALLLALGSLALRANRYWGIWATSFQLVAVIAHLARIVVPQIAADAYAIALLVWSYAALPLLAVATYRHVERTKRFGEDPSWTI